MGKFNRERFLSVLVIVILAALAWASQSQLDELAAKNESLNLEVLKLQQENTSLNGKIAELEEVTKANGPVMSEEIINQNLKEEGLTVEDLKKALRERPDLINHKPVLGGTMFFPEKGIRVLTDKWILAEFEDGHILGYALIEYQVKSGKISFRVIDSYVLQ